MFDLSTSGAERLPEHMSSCGAAVIAGLHTHCKQLKGAAMHAPTRVPHLLLLLLLLRLLLQLLSLLLLLLLALLLLLLPALLRSLRVPHTRHMQIVPAKGARETKEK